MTKSPPKFRVSRELHADLTVETGVPPIRLRRGYVELISKAEERSEARGKPSGGDQRTRKLFDLDRTSRKVNAQRERVFSLRAADRLLQCHLVTDT